MRDTSNDNYRASFGLANSFKLRSIEPPQAHRRLKGQDVRQICVLADVEGGPVLVLSDGRAQWSYEVSAHNFHQQSRSFGRLRSLQELWRLERR